MAELRLKVILPKKFNQKAMAAELQKEMKDIQKEVAGDFADTTRTWDNKPGFDKEFASSTSQMRFFVGTDNEIYGYVSKGTRPHRILPKRGKMLHFQGTYTAKTTPGVISSGSGGSSGAEVFSRGVQHPGTKARDFDVSIKEKWERPFGTRIRSAVKRASSKSGHAI